MKLELAIKILFSIIVISATAMFILMLFGIYQKNTIKQTQKNYIPIEENFVRNINTEGFEVGDVVWIDGWNAGKFTITKHIPKGNLNDKKVGIIVSNDMIKLLKQ